MLIKRDHLVNLTSLEGGRGSRVAEAQAWDGRWPAGRWHVLSGTPAADGGSVGGGGGGGAAARRRENSLHIHALRGERHRRAAAR